MDCWLEVEEKTPTARLMGGGFDGIDGMGWDRIGWMEVAVVHEQPHSKVSTSQC